MEIVDIYSLWPIKEEVQERRSYLMRNGDYTGTIITGQNIEEQIAIGDEHLLLSDDDNLDDYLVIYLLDKYNKTIDQICCIFLVYPEY
jgi:hypothetical protein